MTIHIEPTAVVDPRAELDDDVRIGPFCVVGAKTRIGRGTQLINSVTIMGRVTIGQHNRIFPGAVLGGEPQDISYRGSDTEIVIGDNNVIREGVTINRGTEKEDGVTSLGSHSFIMGERFARAVGESFTELFAAPARWSQRTGPRPTEGRGMNDLRVAVIGVGHLGQIHARLLAQVAGAKLTAIVDPSPDARAVSAE